MDNFKTKTRLNAGCSVASISAGKKCLIKVTGCASQITLNCRVFVRQLNGRNKGFGDAIGHGSTEGCYTEPSPVKIVNTNMKFFTERTCIFAPTYDGKPPKDILPIHEAFDDKPNTPENARYTHNGFDYRRFAEMSITVWTAEKDGKNLKFFLSVTNPVKELSTPEATHKTKAAIWEAECKKKDSEILSLKQKIAKMENSWKEYNIPQFVNSAAREEFLRVLKFEHVTSYDVEFFSVYLQSKNGIRVDLPKRLTKAVERNVRGEGRPPVVARDIYGKRQGLGYVPRNQDKEYYLSEEVQLAKQAYEKEEREYYEEYYAKEARARSEETKRRYREQYGSESGLWDATPY